MLRFAPGLAVAVLLVPVAAGLAATIAPAFGYLPAAGGTAFTLDHFATLWNFPGMPRSIALSFVTGLTTTAIALLTVFAFVAGWSGTATFARVQHLISPLLSVPHAAAAFGLAFLIAPSGLLLRAFSPWATGFDRPPDWLIVGDTAGLAMIAGLVVKEIPFLLLVTLAALPQTQGAAATRLARSFGYGRMATFAFVIWPQVYPQIRLAVFAVIAYASSVVDVAVILGPSVPPTLAVRLTQWMGDPDLSLRFLACAGALVQVAVTSAAIIVWIAGERLAGAGARALRRRGGRMAADGAVRGLGIGAMLFAVGVVFAGLAVLALWSLAGLWSFPDVLPASFTVANWTRAAGTMGGPLGNTATIALAATAIATALALACLERESRTRRDGGNGALWLLYLPLLVPQIAFVFGLQILFLRLGVDATWGALVLVHVVFVLPYVFLSMSDPWRAFDPRYSAVSAGLGASALATFLRIRLPMLLRPVLTAAAVGLAVSIGQYLPTLLVGGGRWPTVTTKAVALASGGDRRLIGVYAFVQLLLPLAGFLLATVLPALLYRHRRGMRPA